MSGPFGDGVELISRVLKAEVPERLRGRLVLQRSLGLITAMRGDFPQARAYCDNAALHLKNRYVVEHGKVLCKRVKVEVMAGELEAARAALAEAETVARGINAVPDSELGRALAEARAALSE